MHDYEVVTSDPVFTGRVYAVRQDVVRMPGGGTGVRDVVVHPGAVAVVALRDGAVLLVTQYRHPVRRRLEELPAGLLDVPGEDPLAAARRELAEEAGLQAATWHVLVDMLTTPGMSDEAIRVYLAQDLAPCPRPVQQHEEQEITTRWVPLGEAAALALSGGLENATCVAGVLAAEVAVQRGLSALRPAESPWPARPEAGART